MLAPVTALSRLWAVANVVGETAGRLNVEMLEISTCETTVWQCLLTSLPRLDQFWLRR
jgi:hypothetical protein